MGLNLALIDLRTFFGLPGLNVTDVSLSAAPQLQQAWSCTDSSLEPGTDKWLEKQLKSDILTLWEAVNPPS